MNQAAAKGSDISRRPTHVSVLLGAGAFVVDEEEVLGELVRLQRPGS